LTNKFPNDPGWEFSSTPTFCSPALNRKARWPNSCVA
jgi:hypothetical protein